MITPEIPHAETQRRRVNSKFSYCTSASLRLCVIIFLVSCQTAPIVSDTISAGKTLPLDSGAFAYVIADVQNAGTILDLLPIEDLKNWQAVLVRESTQMAAAALFTRESGKRFQVTGWGDYPKFGAGIALFFSWNWRRQRTNAGNYWYSNRDKLSVAIDSDQVFAVSWHDSHVNAPRVNPIPASSTAIPEGFIEFTASGGQSAPVSAWMVNPARMLDQMLEDEGIPIRFPAEKLFINLYNAQDNKFEALLRVQFESVSQARGIAAVLALANVFTQGTESVLASIFFANPPIQDGDSIIIKTDTLSEKEISVLLSLFITHWR